jgi:hypothetical protein
VGILTNFLEFCGILTKLLEFCGNLDEFFGVLWNLDNFFGSFAESRRIFWIDVKTLVIFAFLPKNVCYFESKYI